MTDYMNLHTYDLYDWFLLIIGIVVFGMMCLSIGCLCHRAIIRSQNIQDIHDKDGNDTHLDHTEMEETRKLSDVEDHDHDGLSFKKSIEIAVDFGLYDHEKQ